MDRRAFLKRSSLLALSPVIPEFVLNTARAAESDKGTILIVMEWTGGNDGLNTVIPFKDDAYRRARPSLWLGSNAVIKVNDELGLHPGLKGLDRLLQNGHVGIVQGVGYPNPDRSHFESMDRWQTGEVKLPVGTSGWLARSAGGLQKAAGGVPVLHVGDGKLPLSCRGTAGGIFSLNREQPFELKLGDSRVKESRKLLEDLSAQGEKDSSLAFVRRQNLATYSSLDTLNKVVPKGSGGGAGGNTLLAKMNTIASLIQKGFKTRVFYVSIDGFDTHASQAPTQQRLFEEISGAIGSLFAQLTPGPGGDAERVLVLTFSEFGRRVAENGSKGTDHGSGSCLFVIGPGAKGGPIGKHPSLTDLSDGDLKYHTDFRRVYATLLDGWLGVDSKIVLGGEFEHLNLLARK